MFVICRKCGTANAASTRVCLKCRTLLGNPERALEGTEDTVFWPEVVKESADEPKGAVVGTRPRPAEGDAKSLYEVFVQERSGKGFEEAASIPLELEPNFNAKVDLYREALLLMVLVSESQKQKGLQQLLHSYESLVFGTALTVSGLQKVDAAKAAMADLAMLLNSDGNRRELSWGMLWFQDIGHSETNPVRLALFASEWMDEYIALVKTIRQRLQHFTRPEQSRSSFWAWWRR